MYIKVRAITGAKREEVTELKPNYLKITVRQKAEHNLANTRIRELVAAYAKVPVAAVLIINGHHSPHKLLSIQSKMQ